jgi:molybdopterin converting factor small subunit
MAKVQVKLPPHVAQMLNAKSSGWLVLEEETKDQTTVSSLLSSLIANYSGFRETVYNPEAGSLNEQIGVVLNEKLLTLDEISQTTLVENDSILILPLYYGG